jgi:hypothetical protein
LGAIRQDQSDPDCLDLSQGSGSIPGSERWTYRGDIGRLGIPIGVKEAIGKRVGLLSKSTNRTLTLASVIGREFDLSVLLKIESGANCSPTTVNR